MKLFLKKISLFIILFLLVNFALFYTLDSIRSNERIHKQKYTQIIKFSDKATMSLVRKSYVADPTDGNYYILKPGLEQKNREEVENLLHKSGLYNSVLDDWSPHKIWTGMASEFYKFREINKFRNVDVIFLGSSHAFLGFDPRIFQKHNISSFNLGIRGQGPLNAYYLLKRYYHVLLPKIVIIECYFHSIVVDGYEAYLYTLVNHPLDLSVLEMGIAAGGPDAVKSFFIEAVKRLRYPLDRYPDIISKSYIPGGYGTTGKKNDREAKIDKRYNRKFTLSPLQLGYLEKTIRFCQENNSRVFMVTHPLPDVFLSQVINYDEMSWQIQEIAREHNVEYIDFNTIMQLDYYEDFKDLHHLNQSGVNKFNNKLINILLKFDSFKKICQKASLNR